MAIDEALLDWRRDVPNSPPLVRATRWLSPAATLGRFQRYVEFEIENAVRPSTRRITGGGAILHHHEITLAIVAPTPSNGFPDPNPLALAERAAETIRTAIAPDQPALERRGGESNERAEAELADCFERRSPFDLVDEAGVKRAGFALHRRAGRVLIQGSIRRTPSDDASGDTALFVRLARALGFEREPEELPAEVIDRAGRLVESRYGTDEWNHRRK